MTSPDASPPQLQSIVDDLAGEIGRAVVINDLDLRVLVASAQGEPIDRARVESILTRKTPEPIKEYVFGLGVLDAVEPAVVEANPELGILRRLCIPLGSTGTRFGYMWLILDDHELTAEDHAVVTDSRRHAIDAFVAHRAQLDGDRVGASKLLVELLDSDPATRDSAVDEFQRAFPSESRQPLQIHVFRPGNPSQHMTGSTKALTRWESTGTQVPEFLLVSLSDTGATALTRVAEQTGPEVRAMLAAFPAPSAHGVSSPFTDIRDVNTALQQARFAAFLATLVPEFDGTALHGDLGAWLLLKDVPWTLDSVRAISPAAAELAVPGREMLLTTVTEFLDNAGDVAATIAGLHIHRTTFYYRMDKVRDIIGDVLTDGWKSAALHVALRLHRLVEAVAAGERVNVDDTV